MSGKSPTASPRTKGRPRAFDREAALHHALEVFWQRGYEPASITELCAAMGINPPSLYAAFGNKAKLFLEAVQHYEQVYWDAAWERMDQDPDVHRALTEFFRDAARILSATDVPCGCMVVLAAVNVSPESQEVTEAVKALRQEGKDCFLSLLKRGVKRGQLPKQTDVKVLAGALNTLLEGMSLQARDGLSRLELERIATATLTMLPCGAST